MTAQREHLWKLLGVLFQAHPWHGVPIGGEPPRVVNAYIELVPQDTIKYELDKTSGYLGVDRPQTYSNVCPTLYGLIPQTLCAEETAALCIARTGRTGIVGDMDPLDICVLSEKVIPRGDIFLRARPIGGLRMIDGNEADDKIVAVMMGDAVFGLWDDIADAPDKIVNRLRHYFLTYKHPPGSPDDQVEITDVYGREEAYDVIERSHRDYLTRYAEVAQILGETRGYKPHG